ncbi:SsgA family sporulation/cell division regulator [Streptomyces sp. NPDC059355]|uniref:SsgA family sporulation/cell division regulator n=1 Tax=Streptomyces sp. NPDC059355 TaxID=3346811 RepID=UPI0036822B33
MTQQIYTVLPFVLEGSDHEFPLVVRLGFRSDHPYEMSMELLAGPGDRICWTFARDLLLVGRHRSWGEGDVRIWPQRLPGSGRVWIRLRADGGRCALSLGAADVDDWCRRMTDLVPHGSEQDHFDLDEQLRLFLA